MDPITISALLKAGEMAINRIWPDPKQQAEEQRKLAELAQKGDLAELQAHVTLLQGQMRINEQEAKSDSVFVAAWRPFVGWVCGFGLAYVSFIEPLMRFVASMSGYTGDFPEIDTTLTMQVLLGMLGLVAARTREKEKGVSRGGINGIK